MYDTEDITVHDVWWGRVEPLSFTIPPTVTLPSIVTYEYRYVYILSYCQLMYIIKFLTLFMYVPCVSHIPTLSYRYRAIYTISVYIYTLCKNVVYTTIYYTIYYIHMNTYYRFARTVRVTGLPLLSDPKELYELEKALWTLFEEFTVESVSRWV